MSKVKKVKKTPGQAVAVGTPPFGLLRIVTKVESARKRKR